MCELRKACSSKQGEEENEAIQLPSSGKNIQIQGNMTVLLKNDIIHNPDRNELLPLQENNDEH